ncbi:MAG: ATP-binding cassette domain-containing protein [Bacteroidota bacterium]
MLRTENLTFSYDGQQELHFPDINCQQGANCLLLGQSGSGKTTLLHLLGGLRSPQEGKVIIKDTDLGQLSTEALDRFRGQHIGIVFQQSHFIRSLSVLQNLAIAQYLSGTPSDPQRQLHLLERLNIAYKKDAHPETLSQGEQQRLAIARALINKPELILADEPTSALDDQNCEEVTQLLETQAREENATLLIVTHDNRLKSRFDQQIVLDHHLTKP